MSLVESNMLPIGTKAPTFVLPDVVSGEHLALDQIRGEKGTVIMFICNHCPFVIHVNSELVRLTNDYHSRGIGFVAISSNDIVNYPQDAPDKMSKVAKDLGYPFPYLYDESQDVARAYDAACTPDFYIFDQELSLYYRGRLDASRPGNQLPLNGKDLRLALDGMLSGQDIPEAQYPSAGCNIKWKK